MPAYYRASLIEFLADDPRRILGTLATESAKTGFTDLKQRQTGAWQKQIEVLKVTCSLLENQFTDCASWGLLLEYPIPRRQKRIDAVLLARNIIFCLEFKTENKIYSSHLKRQVEDYALDLRDFHEESCNRPIIPVAVALGAPPSEVNSSPATSDLVRPVILAGASDLASRIATVFITEGELPDKPISTITWDLSSYHPVPTIIEAAEALFAGHNVREIAHSHAGAINLTLTSDKLIEIIQQAQRDNAKVICFVTGVPGAGKTLAGLNVVHNAVLRQDDRPPGVFLSGNGPLVRIVSASITRDFKQRTRIGGAERTIGTFVQNVHSFVREALDKPDKPPVEHVIVFDEAQRAWDAVHNKKKTGSELSEPETILSIMGRHSGWAVVVALVGGGQEIHTGEAGLAEWGRSLRERFPHWQIAVSPNALSGDTSVAGQQLFADGKGGALTIHQEPALHLEVNLRSFRARRLSEWVDAVLNGDALRAAGIVADLRDFPVAITRSLTTARTWLRKRARGLRRCGLVASSGAIRLRADGIELSSGFRQGNRDLYVQWFLADPSDVRSSNQLEIAASEFECQGLELDWVGLCWGGDFAFSLATNDWNYRRFTGNRWGEVNKKVNRQYLLNTYRVLLTRAREGMVIWVPTGDHTDQTRSPALFDETAEYLKQCGLSII
ncbi:MAG: DUF2075 domain-containing protein [Acidobacteria bacterium]|nr:DUF2075 domain-containing protein [Acidobacteriota bacterium]MBI3421723.1 DUF2075 domain-containing protein [Acidobacteriota bacterium]